LPNDAVRLRAFFTLNDVEDDLLAFLEVFITIFLNRTEVDEYVIAVIAAKEAIAFDVAKPLHGAFVLAHRIHLFCGSN